MRWNQRVGRVEVAASDVAHDNGLPSLSSMATTTTLSVVPTLAVYHSAVCHWAVLSCAGLSMANWSGSFRALLVGPQASTEKPTQLLGLCTYINGMIIGSGSINKNRGHINGEHSSI